MFRIHERLALKSHLDNLAPKHVFEFGIQRIFIVVYFSISLFSIL